MTDLTPAELRRLAEAATPGLWSVRITRDRGVEGNEPPTGHMSGRLSGPTYVPDYEDTIISRHDARFIAAANPTTVLSLLDALDAKDAELHDAWKDGMGVGYKAGKEPLWIPPENPYRKELT